MLLMVLGVVLLVAAAALESLAVRRRRVARRLDLTDNHTIGGLRELHREVEREGLSGAFRQPADVVGEVRCAEPLKAPLSGQACVWYRSRVVAELERERVDVHGGIAVARAERVTRTVSDEQRSVEFELYDGAGITVDPHEAQVVGPEVAIERYEPAESPAGPFGARSTVPGPVRAMAGMLTRDGEERVRGYRRTEEIIPVGARVFVHGTVTDADGRPAFRRSAGELIISRRSEEELREQALRGARWRRSGAVAATVAGAAAVIFGAMAL